MERVKGAVVRNGIGSVQGGDDLDGGSVSR